MEEFPGPTRVPAPDRPDLPNLGHSTVAFHSVPFPGLHGQLHLIRHRITPLPQHELGVPPSRRERFVRDKQAVQVEEVVLAIVGDSQQVPGASVSFYIMLCEQAGEDVGAVAGLGLDRFQGDGDV
jgi:hypothetical protein